MVTNFYLTNFIEQISLFISFYFTNNIITFLGRSYVIIGACLSVCLPDILTGYSNMHNWNMIKFGTP